MISLLLASWPFLWKYILTPLQQGIFKDGNTNNNEPGREYEHKIVSNCFCLKNQL